MTFNTAENLPSVNHENPTPARVLLAMYAASDSREALKRAYAFSKTLGAELLVLSVLPAFRGSNMLFPQKHLLDAMRTIEMGKRAFRFARRVCTQALPTRVDDDNILVQQGDFLATVVGVAKEFNVGLVVLPPAEGRHGSRVTKLARLTQTPVLIARPPGSTETIIAASDLQDQQYPILKRANRLSHRLDAPVVFVHNVSPATSLGDAEHPGDDELHARKNQLKRASESLASNADNVILSAVSTSEAILSLACQKRADLIVIGAHRRGWLERVLSPGVAAEVAEKATRSVLIEPLQ